MPNHLNHLLHANQIQESAPVLGDALMANLHRNPFRLSPSCASPKSRGRSRPTNFCAYMVYLGNSAGGYFNLHDIRVSHAIHAFYGTARVKADISNCQVIDCNFGFKNNSSFWNLRNILMARVGTAFDGFAPLTNSAENLTVYGVNQFLLAGLPTVNLTNSLLICVTNNVSYNGAYVQTNLS